MGIQKLQIAPGVVRSPSAYASPGRYVDMQWARFVDGYPQKIPGFRRTEVNGMLDGVCRAIWSWRANDNVDYCAFGTHKKLYEMHQGVLTDITPLRPRRTGNLFDAFDTVINSTDVTVHHTGHNLKVGDWATFTPIGSPPGAPPGQAGAQPWRGGNFRVVAVVDANTYIVTIDVPAPSTETTAGGSVQYDYYRILLPANPISTVAGSTIVTINDANSGALAGDTVIVEGATAVGGITLNGPYTVLTVTLTTITVDAGVAATATATGGGANVSLQYEINIGLIETVVGYGYGTGPYGMEAYGTARTATVGVPIQLRTWHLENYGEWLLANPSGGSLYVWKPQIGGRALRLYGSPITMNSFFVTAERYIVALGTMGDSMQIAWNDQNDPEVWVATDNNTANQSRKINGGNMIVCGVQVRNQTSLIWTDQAVFLHQWRADDFVFTTTKLADHCGIMGAQAFAQLDETVYWVSDGRFLQWNGALSEMPSEDIGEWFFNRLNDTQRGKIFACTIGNFSEIIILYQASDQIGADIDNFLLFNTSDRVWSTSYFDHICTTRTAVHDRGVFRAALATGYNGAIFDHGIGHDAYNAPGPTATGTPIRSWITAAPIDIQAGIQNLDIMSFLPDMARQDGNLTVTVLTRTRAINSIEASGPYTMTPQGRGLDIRVAGNMAGYTIESNVLGGDYRLGMCRVEFQGSGNRRAA